MSDDVSDSGSDASQDVEDVAATGLIATRAKRATAGNLYATLRANLDDEELQKDLLAEDEEDQADYEGSDKYDEDDDDAFESSSDEDDAGPPKEGEAEDLEGEKELKKAERAHNKKKRKMEEAKMRLPVNRKKKKVVTLADDVKTADGSTAQRPRKKSERSNWLPTAADMPVRQSARASAIANREIIHTNLKESAIRSEKQKQVMAKHAEKVQATKRAELTQEERLAKATRIEKETAKEFGRWEREEAERQRIRDEQLAAKRNRGIDGAFVRHWSGSVLWEGDKIKEKRLFHGSKSIEELESETKDASGDTTMGGTEVASKAVSTADVSEMTSVTGTPPVAPVNPPSQVQPPAQMSWLDGIQEYAAQQPGQPPPQPNPYIPSAPAIHSVSQHLPQQPVLAPHPPIYPPPHIQPNMTIHPAPAPIYHAWPGYQEFALNRPQFPLPPAAPEPLIKQQAQRSLIMLEQFENLETSSSSTKKSTGKAGKDATVEPTPLASSLLPSAYPSFNVEETRYLTAKWKKTGGTAIFPPGPSKAICHLTSWPAKYHDPKTNLYYADLQTYKMIQRLLAGGCTYSSMLGAYAGPCYTMGRPASGVPEGFATTAQSDTTAGEVKVEGG